MLPKSFVGIYGHSMNMTRAVYTGLQQHSMAQDSVHAQMKYSAVTSKIKPQCYL